MWRAVLLLTLSIFMASCSQKPEQAHATIGLKVQALTNASAMNQYGGGGLVIYGHNSTTGQKFARTYLPPYSTIELDLDLGTWEFHTILWDGDEDLNGTTDNAKLTGLTRCGHIASSVVEGDTTVNFNLSKGNCANGAFSPAAHITNAVISGGTPPRFQALKLVSCNFLQHLTGLPAATEAQNECDAPAEKSLKLSYKVKVKSYDGGVASGPVLQSACYGFAPGFEENFLQLPVRLPFGTSNTSPFFIEIDGYETHDCTIPLNGGDGPGKITMAFKHGIGQAAELLLQNPDTNQTEVKSLDTRISDYDMAPGGVIPTTEEQTIMHVAVNENGAGFTPFWANLPYVTCFQDTGAGGLGGDTPTDCVQRFDRKQFIGRVGGPSDTIRISVYKLYGGASTVSHCDITATTGITFDETNPVAVQGSGGDEYCEFSVNTLSGNSSDSTSPGTFNITLQLCDGSTGSACNTSLPFHHLNQPASDTPATSQTFNVFYEGEGSIFAKSQDALRTLTSIVGYYSAGPDRESSCLGTDCGYGPFAEGDGHYKDESVAGILRDTLGVEEFGGVLYKLGYTSCAQVQTAASSTTIYNFGAKTLKIVPATKKQAAFMPTPANNFDYRLELLKSGVLVVAVEGLCGSPNYLLYLNKDMDEGDRVEQSKVYAYIKGQSKVATSGQYYGDGHQPAEIEYIYDQDEEVSTQSRWSHVSGMAKFHYLGADGAAGVDDYNFKFWAVNSMRRKDMWGATHMQFYHNERVFLAGDANTKSVYYNLLDPSTKKSVSAFTDPFSAPYPVDKDCSISTSYLLSAAGIQWTSAGSSAADCAGEWNSSSGTPPMTVTVGTEPVPCSNQIGTTALDFTFASSICTAGSGVNYMCSDNYTTTLTNLNGTGSINSTLPDQFDVFKIFSADACTQKAEELYGTGLGVGAVSGVAGAWNSNQSLNDLTNPAHYLLKKCMIIDGTSFNEAGTCPTDVANNYTATTGTLPSMGGFKAGKGFSGIVSGTDFDNTSWNINFIGDTVTPACGGKSEAICKIGF